MTHPATETVLWTWSHEDRYMGRSVERAVYHDQKLMVRATGEFEVANLPSCVMGFVNGKYIGTRPNMPQICDMLFAYVDWLVGLKRT